MSNLICYRLLHNGWNSPKKSHCQKINICNLQFMSLWRENFQRFKHLKKSKNMISQISKTILVIFKHCDYRNLWFVVTRLGIFSSSSKQKRQNKVGRQKILKQWSSNLTKSSLNPWVSDFTSTEGEIMHSTWNASRFFWFKVLEFGHFKILLSLI